MQIQPCLFWLWVTVVMRRALRLFVGVASINYQISNWKKKIPKRFDHWVSEWVSRSNWYCIKKVVLGWIILLVFLENIPSYACLEMYGFICMDNLIFYLYAYSEFFLLISWHIGVINGWKQRSAICKEFNCKF